ncbi:hypothetical protein BaRGS_00018676 [Batillaria attramentaria]|uniref:Uncharacterized protein n=1 Tax=Batillaria attramentaria TaxID=370345 RepID=A0ABD0KSG4_9CAEN
MLYVPLTEVTLLEIWDRRETAETEGGEGKVESKRFSIVCKVASHPSSGVTECQAGTDGLLSVQAVLVSLLFSRSVPAAVQVLQEHLTRVRQPADVLSLQSAVQSLGKKRKKKKAYADAGGGAMVARETD